MESMRADLEKVYEKIQEKTLESQLPRIEDAKELVRLSKLLHINSEEDWAGEAEDFWIMAQKLFHAVKSEIVEEAIIVVDSLEDLFKLLPSR